MRIWRQWRAERNVKRGGRSSGSQGESARGWELGLGEKRMSGGASGKEGGEEEEKGRVVLEGERGCDRGCFWKIAGSGW